MHDSTNCPTCQELPNADSMTDAAFLSFVETCRDELQQKQTSFTAMFEPKAEWQYDLFKETLTIGGQTYPVVAVGSHSGENQTWIWAWANKNLPKNARASAEDTRELFERTGFKVFNDEGADASVEDSEDLAAMALHQLGGIGLFLSPEDGATLYLAVFDPIAL